jgi:hypothetical protein
MDIVLGDFELEVARKTIHPATWTDFCSELFNLDIFRTKSRNSQYVSAVRLLHEAMMNLFYADELALISGYRDQSHYSVQLESNPVERRVKYRTIQGLLNPLLRSQPGFQQRTTTQAVSVQRVKRCNAYLTLNCFDQHQRFMENYFHGIADLLDWAPSLT